MKKHSLVYSITGSLAKKSKVFWVFVSVLLAMFLIFYVFQINIKTQQISLIQNYRNKMENLSQENEDLKINFLQVNSFENIETLIKELNFEKLSQTYFVQIIEDQIVIVTR